MLSICGLGIGDDLLDRLVGVVHPLQHLQPRSLRRVDQLEELQRVRRLGDGDRLAPCRRRLRPRRSTGCRPCRRGWSCCPACAYTSTWTSSERMNLMKSTASSTRSEPFGTVTMSPPANDAVWPVSRPGRSVTPRSMSGFCCLASTTLKLPVPMIPTLPDPNTSANVLAVLRLSGRVDQTLLVHRARPLQHRRDVLADQRLVAALGRLDRAARRPDHRGEGEDVAPRAVARQVVPVVAVAEGVDLAPPCHAARCRLVGGCSGSRPACSNKPLFQNRTETSAIQRHAVQPASQVATARCPSEIVLERRVARRSDR